MVNKFLISQRLEMINEWLKELRKISGYTYKQFMADNRNVAAAESYLRRSLEAIFDIGRHILAKTGSVDMAGEYKTIARGLKDKKFVSAQLGDKLVSMAGYRNRMVHFYSLITDDELFDILQNHLNDIEEFISEIRRANLT